MISYKTNMDDMPDNCMKCTFTLCQLPLTKDEEFMPECRVVRHVDCPLIKVRLKDKRK